MTSSHFPQESDSQRIGRLALKAFEANCPDDWIPNRTDGDADAGLDVQVQIVQDGLHKSQFHAQVKGSEREKKDGRSALLNADGTFFSVKLKTSTLNWYLGIESPKMLIFSDLSENKQPAQCNVYYCWIDDKLEALLLKGQSRLPAEPKTITIRVPTENRITAKTEILPYIEQRLQLRALAANTLRAVEKPGEPPLERATKLVEQLQARRISVDSILEDPGERPWVSAPENSIAEKLRASAIALANNRFSDVTSALNEIEELIPESGANHELAELKYQRGQCKEAIGDYSTATSCYERARELWPEAVHYDLAWVHASICQDYLDKEKARVILKHIETKENKKYRFPHAKTLALLGRREEALVQIQALTGLESIVAKAVVEFISRNSSECLNACGEGLQNPHLNSSARMIFLQLRARSLFDRGCPHEEGSRIPFRGPSDANPEILRKAWRDIKEYWRLAEEFNYPETVELAVDITAFLGCYFEDIEAVLGHLKRAAKIHQYRDNLQQTIWNSANISMRLTSLKRKSRNFPKGLKRYSILRLYSTARVIEARSSTSCSNNLKRSSPAKNNGISR